jgi:hypothetical protein
VLSAATIRNRAVCQHRLKRAQDAVESYEEFLILQPEADDVRQALAQVGAERERERRERER